MNSANDEQTELLRDIWKQMVALDQNVTSRLDGVTSRLDGVTSRLDGVTSRLDTLTAFVRVLAERMQENFGRIQRNFDRMHDTFERLIAELDPAHRERLHDLDTRVTEIERHVGIRRD
jgi:polyhydroxyalkanoate synthesis regulator phasin